MTALKTAATRLPYALISSYVFDWICVIILVAVGFVIEIQPPNHYPFSLTDPSISLPLLEETVTTTTLVIVALIGPVVIILFMIPFVVPGSTSPNRGFGSKNRVPASLLWARRAWELHASWLGLVVALSSVWFVTNGIKQLVGRPRPNAIARCQPDLTGPILQYVVGGVLTPQQDGRVVSVDICANPDHEVIDEGFRSFPSAHSSFGAGGLVYLSLFLLAKLRAAIPAYAYQNDRYLGQPCDIDEARGADAHFAAFPSRLDTRPHLSRASSSSSDSPGGATMNGDLEQGPSNYYDSRDSVCSVRQQGAAPPFYLIILSAIPMFASVYIALSRWYDYYHHGFDIIFGWCLGALFACVSFWYYHPAVSRGGGWAWGPRSRGRAFWMGLGLNSWSRGAGAKAGMPRRGVMAAGAQPKREMVSPETPMGPSMQPVSPMSTAEHHQVNGTAM